MSSREDNKRNALFIIKRDYIFIKTISRSDFAYTTCAKVVDW